MTVPQRIKRSLSPAERIPELAGTDGDRTEVKVISGNMETSKQWFRKGLQSRQTAGPLVLNIAPIPKTTRNTEVEVRPYLPGLCYQLLLSRRQPCCATFTTSHAKPRRGNSRIIRA